MSAYIYITTGTETQATTLIGPLQSQKLDSGVEDYNENHCWDNK